MEKELQARIKELEPLQAQNASLKAENESLKAFKVQCEKQARMAKVQSIVDLKIRWGMLGPNPKDLAQAYSDLEKLSPEALDVIERELKAAEIRLQSMPSGPKAKRRSDEAQVGWNSDGED